MLPPGKRNQGSGPQNDLESLAGLHEVDGLFRLAQGKAVADNAVEFLLGIDQDVGEGTKGQNRTGVIQQLHTKGHQKCGLCVVQNSLVEDLKMVVENWEKLSEEVKAGILATVRASKDK